MAKIKIAKIGVREVTMKEAKKVKVLYQEWADENPRDRDKMFDLNGSLFKFIDIDDIDLGGGEEYTGRNKNCVHWIVYSPIRNSIIDGVFHSEQDAQATLDFLTIDGNPYEYRIEQRGGRETDYGERRLNPQEVETRMKEIRGTMELAFRL